MLSLKLQAKPDDALAANFPAMAPENRLTTAITSISTPYFKIAGISDRSSPLSMISAVINGSSTSMSTSRVVNPIVRNVSLLYCFSCLRTVLIP